VKSASPSSAVAALDLLAQLLLASGLERDLGHEQASLERPREAVSATRELGLRMILARQLQKLASLPPPGG
jgi:cytosine/adenosine deaminase-related metal-dependent hydrolase